jgi:3-oxoisoapionate decarboxylase
MSARVRFGLNPYGLTYHLGLQGAGTPRANPHGTGLRGFIALAEELRAEAIEIFNPWLAALSDRDLAALADELKAKGLTPIASAGLMAGDFDLVLRSARALGIKVIRLAPTSVLCGDRAKLGDDWPKLVETVGRKLAEIGPRADDEGMVVAIENHQDFGSAELVAFCESARGLGITLDTGNAFPVAEAPLAFVERAARHIRHVHLKDYNAQFTDEGFRLVRSAIGDGATPIAAMLDRVAAEGRDFCALLEPGALDARHVRLFTPGWWTHYPRKDASELAACLGALRVKRLADDADYRTPWERGADGELEAYELAMIRRSAETMRTLPIFARSAS